MGSCRGRSPRCARPALVRSAVCSRSSLQTHFYSYATPIASLPNECDRPSRTLGGRFANCRVLNFLYILISKSTPRVNKQYFPGGLTRRQCAVEIVQTRSTSLRSYAWIGNRPSRAPRTEKSFSKSGQNRHFRPNLGELRTKTGSGRSSSTGRRNRRLRNASGASVLIQVARLSCGTYDVIICHYLAIAGMPAWRVGLSTDVTDDDC